MRKKIKKSDYLLPNLYGLKINSIAWGDNLCNKTSTNVPISIDEKTVTVQGQKSFILNLEERKQPSNSFATWISYII